MTSTALAASEKLPTYWYLVVLRSDQCYSTYVSAALLRTRFILFMQSPFNIVHNQVLVLRSVLHASKA